MDVIGFRPSRNLQNQSKPYSHHPAASLHQKRENCSEENSHFQWRTRVADQFSTLELEGCDIISVLNKGKEDGDG